MPENENFGTVEVSRDINWGKPLVYEAKPIRGLGIRMLHYGWYTRCLFFLPVCGGMLFSSSFRSSGSISLVKKLSKAEIKAP